MNSELLRTTRERLNLSVAGVSLQTGISKNAILKNEDSSQKQDEAIIIILTEYYKNKDSDLDNIRLYANWLSNLKTGEKIILKEETIGTTDSFYYTTYFVKEITKKYVILDNQMKFDLLSGEVEYDAPNGMILKYKLFPYTTDVKNSKISEFLQKIIALVTTGGIL